MSLPPIAVPIAVPHPHVEARAEFFGGSPMIRGTRVPVRRLWFWHRHGIAVDGLVRRYAKVLTPAQVYDALSFAHDNEEVVEADLARERSLLEAGS